jgi:hypothetical protein
MNMIGGRGVSGIVVGIGVEEFYGLGLGHVRGVGRGLEKIVLFQSGEMKEGVEA